MGNKPTSNLVASVRQRPANVARSRGEDFQYLLTRYGLERLLYRLSQSAHAGAFTQWTAFLRKGKLTNAPASLIDVTALLEPFLMPPTAGVAAGKKFDLAWLDGAPWK